LLARTLGFSRHSYYYKLKLPKKDHSIAEHIRRIYKDNDDTLGSKKLAKQISTETGKSINHKRVARVMNVQGLLSRPRKAKYCYPGKTAEPFANLTRAIAKYELDIHKNTEQTPEILRSDILECRLADGSKIRVAFAWRETTAQILSLVIDWRMQAELIVQTLRRIPKSCTDHIQNKKPTE